MKDKATLNQQIISIFEDSGSAFFKQHLMVVRQDGITIFSNKENKTSEAALIGGLWQAAHQLKEMSEIDGSESKFRLSFDLSDKGICIRSIAVKDQSYYVALIFKKVVNTGLLKKQLADFSDILMTKLSENITNEVVIEKNDSEGDNSGGYLFNNLTDAEIDNAFSCIGG